MESIKKGAITIAVIIGFLYFACGPDGLTKKEDINSQLRVAAGLGRVDDVMKLLEQGADVNAGGPGTERVPAGGSALMLAAGNNQEAVVRLLLSKGAAPNQKGAPDLSVGAGEA